MTARTRRASPRRKAPKPADDERFDVQVWDMRDGDLVKLHRDVSADEADRIRAEWEDEPFTSVIVEDR